MHDLFSIFMFGYSSAKTTEISQDLTK